MNSSWNISLNFSESSIPCNYESITGMAKKAQTKTLCSQLLNYVRKKYSAKFVTSEDHIQESKESVYSNIIS